MENHTQIHENANPSRAQLALEKLRIARARARETILVEVARLEKAANRDQFFIGTAVLDNPRLCEALLPLLADDLRTRVANYHARKEELVRLKAQMP